METNAKIVARIGSNWAIEDDGQVLWLRDVATGMQYASYCYHNRTERQPTMKYFRKIARARGIAYGLCDLVE